MTLNIAEVEAFLTEEAQSPEVHALLFSLLAKVEPYVESRTPNPILRQLEVAAFSFVRARLGESGGVAPALDAPASTQ